MNFKMMKERVWQRKDMVYSLVPDLHQEDSALLVPQLEDSDLQGGDLMNHIARILQEDLEVAVNAIEREEPRSYLM